MTQENKGKATFIKMDTPPMKDGKVDVAAILAANGITGIDLSQVKVIESNEVGDVANIIEKVQKP